MRANYLAGKNVDTTIKYTPLELQLLGEIFNAGAAESAATLAAIIHENVVLATPIVSIDAGFDCFHSLDTVEPDYIVACEVKGLISAPCELIISKSHGDRVFDELGTAGVLAIASSVTKPGILIDIARRCTRACITTIGAIMKISIHTGSFSFYVRRAGEQGLGHSLAENSQILSVKIYLSLSNDEVKLQFNIFLDSTAAETLHHLMGNMAKRCYTAIDPKHHSVSVA